VDKKDIPTGPLLVGDTIGDICVCVFKSEWVFIRDPQSNESNSLARFSMGVDMAGGVCLSGCTFDSDFSKLR